MRDAARIVPFSAQYALDFRNLNLAWIREHWEPEAADFEVLDHPLDRIITPGGYIGIALQDQQVIGTCALIKHSTTHYELAKMAVAPPAKGLGIGRQLGNDAIEQAKSRGAALISLDSNRILTPAISLYHSLGFVEIESSGSVYERANIYMEMTLTTD